MNIMTGDAIGQFLGDSVLLERLFWATIELTVLAAAVWVGIRIFRKLSPRVRALLWLLVLVKPLVALCVGAAMPIFEVEVVQPPLTTVQESTPHALPATTTAVSKTAPAATPSSSSATSTNPDSGATASATAAKPVQTIPAIRPEAPERMLKITWPGFPVLFAYSWIVIALLLGLYKGLDVIRLRRLIRTSNVPSTALKERYEAIVNHIGVKHPPRLCITETLETPALAGVLRPVILLPQWMLNDRYEAAVDWALRHELIHWKHGDTLANLLRQITQALFFFHPLAWFAGKRWEEEAELACDRALINTTDEANEYAHSLYEVLDQLHGRRQCALATGLFATRTQVGRRITALLTNPLRYSARLGISMTCILLMVTMTTLAVGGAFSDNTSQTAAFTLVDSTTGGTLQDVEVTIYLDHDDITPVIDSTGRIVIPVEEKSRFATVILSKPGYVTQWWNMDAKRIGKLAGDYVIKTEPSITIGGRVVNNEGNPISNATVQVSLYAKGYPEPGPALLDHDIQTDVNGEWRCDRMPSQPKSLDFMLSHDDYMSDTMAGKRKTPSLESLKNFTATFIMQRGVSVRGRVLDERSQPLADAEVLTGLARYGFSFPQTHTDDAGVFSFSNFMPGLMEFTVIKEGFAPELQKIAVGDSMPEIAFSLKPGNTLSMKVVGPDGAPIPKVTIETDTWRGCQTLDWKTTTDDEGYALWNSAPEDVVNFRISKAEYVGLDRYPLQAGTEEQVITLHPLLHITGNVTSKETGSLLETFTIVTGTDMIPADRPVGWHYWKIQTYTDGAYDIKIEPNQYLKIEAEGHLPVLSPLFTGASGNQQFDAALKAGEPISGIILQPDGAPAENAGVVLSSSSVYCPNGEIGHIESHKHAYSDNRGQFTLLPELNPCNLVILHETGYAMQEVIPPVPSLTITLTPWGRVEGQLLIGNASGGDKKVYMNTGNTNSEIKPYVRATYAAHTEQHGRFTIERVMAGTWRLQRVIDIDKLERRYSNDVRINVEPGKTTTVTIGGTGCPVHGYIQLPEGISPDIDLNSKDAYIMSLKDHELLMAASTSQEKDRVVIGSQYQFIVQPDGTFTVEDVPSGDYILYLDAYKTLPDSTQKILGKAEKQFTIPDMPTGRSDTPFELGDIPFIDNPENDIL
jgi:beta-lactamase regulating signal transducer with metallopeptidase domain